MAKSQKNVVTYGLSGKIGDLLVFRQVDGKTIVSKIPKQSKTVLEKQQKQRNRFQQATIYAKSALGDARATAHDARATARDTRATARDARATARDARATARDTRATARDTRATARDARATARDARATARALTHSGLPVYPLVHRFHRLTQIENHFNQ
jgi:hypothetical protein